MSTLFWVIRRGGVPAFFFFSFILMLLWNEIVVGQLGWGIPLTYLQTAACWFMISIACAWVGLASRSAWFFGFGPIRRRIGQEVRREVEREIESHIASHRTGESAYDLGDQIERKIKRGFARWVGTDEDYDWSELGDLIEEKIKDRFRGWVDEE